MNLFFSISEPVEGLYREKGSKFLAFAYPVSSEDEIKQRLETLRKQYHDARHHCYAFVIGLKDQHYRSYDDGEPGHSAGDPILGQIRSFGLTNTLVVVVRYFGGTKLGVGGLVHAYKTASADALGKAEKVALYTTRQFTVEFGYESTSEVEKVLSEFDIEFTNRSFTDTCRFTGKVKDENAEVLLSRLKLLKGVRADQV